MSAFEEVHAKFYVDLPMYQIGNLKQAAKSEIIQKLLTYDDTIEGSILGFKNIKPTEPFCKVYADGPALHVQLEADFMVFKPKVGCVLPGKVSFISSSSLNLLVLGKFNATVDFSEFSKKWSFQQQCWECGEVQINNGDVLLLTVLDVITDSEGPSMTVRVEKKLAESTEQIEE